MQNVWRKKDSARWKLGECIEKIGGISQIWHLLMSSNNRQPVSVINLSPMNLFVAKHSQSRQLIDFHLMRSQFYTLCYHYKQDIHIIIFE